MTDLDEVDRDSDPADHLGDYRPEHGDPYPATQEAWARTTVTLPRDVHADPAEVRHDFARYGADPGKLGTLVRPLAATGWAANGFLLSDGAQGFRLIEADPRRTRTLVYNHSAGAVWVAPTPTRSPGFGAMLIPGRDTDGRVHGRELRVTSDVYLFTLPGYAAGAGQGVADVEPSVVVGADPAPGAEVLVTVPAGEVWDLQSVIFTLVTDATAGNRRVNLRIDDGTNPGLRLVASADVAASTTVTFTGADVGVEYGAARDGTLVIATPSIRLGPGWRIRTTTTGIQAGDNFSTPVVTYVRTLAADSPGVHVQVLMERWG